MFPSYTASRKRALALMALVNKDPRLNVPMRIILIAGEVAFIVGELALESGTKTVQRTMDRIQEFVHLRENKP